MKASELFCPVCRVTFRLRGPVGPGDPVTCPICGAALEAYETAPGELALRRQALEPAREIGLRVDTFATLRGYVFDDMKPELVAGLVAKEARFGDFYCPCRFMHVPEFVCPCLETRTGQVERDGRCY
jgi:ferredoxin-thioredoxin reductase catalytic subunit